MGSVSAIILITNSYLLSSYCFCDFALIYTALIMCCRRVFMLALDIKNLQKTYASGVQALKGIDLQVEKGDFYALLGPNGAGKSTTIGIISSLVNNPQVRYLYLARIWISNLKPLKHISGWCHKSLTSANLKPYFK